MRFDRRIAFLHPTNQGEFPIIQSIKRLDQGLDLWSTKCFIRGTGEKLARQPEIEAEYERLPLNGPLVHAPSFRKYLLQSFQGNEPFDHDKYLGNERINDALGAAGDLPWFMWQWNKKSRRVFQVTQELQLLLGVTSLDEVTWGDIRLPFPSFGVALVDPIVDERSQKKFDFLLVSLAEQGGSWFYNFILFPQALETYQPVTLAEKRDLEKAFQRRHWHKVQRIIQKCETRRQGLDLVRMNYSFEGSKDKTIEDVQRFSGDFPENTDPLSLFKKVARIIFGLCLYLKSLPPGSSAVQEEPQKRKPPRAAASPDTSCISDIAQVCTVSSVHKLTDEERTVLKQCRSGAGGYEVRAHFRIGHWRRPPGLGSDPTAERTVWVRPTLVRRDRVPEGRVPGGAETQV